MTRAGDPPGTSQAGPGLRGLLRNAGAMMAQVVFSALALLVTYWLLMRALSMEEIGLWSLVVGSATVSRVLEVGLGSGVVRFVAADVAAGAADRAARTVGMAGLLVAVLVGSFALLLYPLLGPWLTSLVPAVHHAALAQLLPATLAAVVLGSISSVMLGAVDGNQRMDLRAVLMVVASLIQLVGTWYALPRWGVGGLGYVQVFQSAFLLGAGLLATLLLLRQPLAAYFRFDGTRLRELFGYGGKLQLAALGQLLYEPTLKVMLTLFSGLALAGYVDIATRILMQFRQVLVSACNALVPYVAALAGQSGLDADAVRETYRRSFGLLLSIMLPYFACVAAGLPLALVLWKGHYDQTLLAVTLLQLPAIWLGTVMAPAYLVYTGLGRLAWIIASHLLGPVLVVVLGTVLGTVFGAEGVLVAGAVTIGFISLLVVAGFHREYAFPLRAVSTRYRLAGLVLSVLALVLAAGVAASPDAPAVLVLWAIPFAIGAAAVAIAWMDPECRLLWARVTRTG